MAPSTRGGNGVVGGNGVKGEGKKNETSTVSVMSTRGKEATINEKEDPRNKVESSSENSGNRDSELVPSTTTLNKKGSSKSATIDSSEKRASPDSSSTADQNEAGEKSKEKNAQVGEEQSSEGGGSTCSKPAVLQNVESTSKEKKKVGEKSEEEMKGQDDKCDKGDMKSAEEFASDKLVKETANATATPEEKGASPPSEKTSSGTEAKARSNEENASSSKTDIKDKKEEIGSSSSSTPPTVSDSKGNDDAATTKAENIVVTDSEASPTTTDSPRSPAAEPSTAIVVPEESPAVSAAASKESAAAAGAPSVPLVSPKPEELPALPPKSDGTEAKSATAATTKGGESSSSAMIVDAKLAVPFVPAATTASAKPAAAKPPAARLPPRRPLFLRGGDRSAQDATYWGKECKVYRPTLEQIQSQTFASYVQHTVIHGAHPDNCRYDSDSDSDSEPEDETRAAEEAAQEPESSNSPGWAPINSTKSTLPLKKPPSNSHMDDDHDWNCTVATTPMAFKQGMAKVVLPREFCRESGIAHDRTARRDPAWQHGGNLGNIQLHSPMEQIVMGMAGVYEYTFTDVKSMTIAEFRERADQYRLEQVGAAFDNLLFDSDSEDEEAEKSKIAHKKSQSVATPAQPESKESNADKSDEQNQMTAAPGSTTKETGAVTAATNGQSQTAESDAVNTSGDREMVDAQEQPSDTSDQQKRDAEEPKAQSSQHQGPQTVPSEEATAKADMADSPVAASSDETADQEKPAVGEQAATEATADPAVTDECTGACTKGDEDGDKADSAPESSVTQSGGTAKMQVDAEAGSDGTNESGSKPAVASGNDNNKRCNGEKPEDYDGVNSAKQQDKASDSSEKCDKGSDVKVDEKGCASTATAKMQIAEGSTSVAKKGEAQDEPVPVVSESGQDSIDVSRICSSTTGDQPKAKPGKNSGGDDTAGDAPVDASVQTVSPQKAQKETETPVEMLSVKVPSGGEKVQSASAAGGNTPTSTSQEEAPEGGAREQGAGDRGAAAKDDDSLESQAKKERERAQHMAGLQRLFWKRLGPTMPSAWYGADQEGTFFQHDDPASGWSLAYLDSCLHLLHPKVPGVTSPYLYLGMWASVFCVHTEDMNLLSVNYLHAGAPKLWYAVAPGPDSERLEALATHYFSQQSQNCKEFLRHKRCLLSPMVLRKAGIPFTTVVQYPGEAVITFPGGYHFGFNSGFNVAEATNFAVPEWIPYGRRAKVCLCRPHSVRIDMNQFIALYQAYLKDRQKYKHSRRRRQALSFLEWSRSQRGADSEDEGEAVTANGKNKTKVYKDSQLWKKSTRISLSSRLTQGPPAATATTAGAKKRRRMAGADAEPAAAASTTANGGTGSGTNGDSVAAATTKKGTTRKRKAPKSEAAATKKKTKGRAASATEGKKEFWIEVVKASVDGEKKKPPPKRKRGQKRGKKENEEEAHSGGGDVWHLAQPITKKSKVMVGTRVLVLFPATKIMVATVLPAAAIGETTETGESATPQQEGGEQQAQEVEADGMTRKSARKKKGAYDGVEDEQCFAAVVTDIESGGAAKGKKGKKKQAKEVTGGSGDDYVRIHIDGLAKSDDVWLPLNSTKMFLDGGRYTEEHERAQAPAQHYWKEVDSKHIL